MWNARAKAVNLARALSCMHIIRVHISLPNKIGAELKYPYKRQCQQGSSL